MADIKAALAHARLAAKTAGNAGNTGNTENNSSDIKPFGAIERLATPATQAGGGLLPICYHLHKVATSKWQQKRHL